MASCHVLISNLLLKPCTVAAAAAASSSSSSTRLIKPLTLSLHQHLHLHNSLPVPSTRPHFCCNSFSSLIQTDHDNPRLDSHQEGEGEGEGEEEEELASENPINALSRSLLTQQHKGGEAINNVKLPNLTIKEKKELASYAHGLGKKLKIQLVGKSGVTDSLAAAFVENLESNELLKVKIHNSCAGELSEAVQQLEVKTGSVAVGQIGRSVILYRPSITKLKAEEKKRQNQRIMAGKRFRPKHTEFQVKPSEFRSKPDELKMGKKEAASNFSARGRRGSSRSEFS